MLDSSTLTTSEAQAVAILPYVETVAKTYAKKNRKLDPSEVRSEATAGLLEALKTYDPSRGDVVGYAIQKVRFHLSNYYRDNKWATVKVSRGTAFKRATLAAAVKAITPPMVMGAILERERLEALREALNDLSETDRAVLEALVFDGVTRADYARECGVTKSAIDHRYLQAVKHLRQKMGVSL